MMKLKWLAPLAALASIGAAAPAPAPIELVMRPVLDAQGGYAALDLTISFQGERDGQTEIILPNEWGGHDQLYKALRDLHLKEGALIETKLPHVRLAQHAPGARLTLTYRIVDDANGPPAKQAGGNDYRPIIRPGYFHVLGNAIVARLAKFDGEAPARFRLEGLPRGAAFASDMEHGDGGRALKANDLIESVSVGGDFRIVNAGEGMRLAIRGQWERSDESWRNAFVKIADAERSYWGGIQENYLVTVMQINGLPPSATSIGGTGRSDAFAFFATPNARPETVDRIMTHEMMHTWIPRRIGSMPSTNEQVDYWLSEGFTDWATLRVMARAGMVTPQAWAAAFNEALRDYEVSPVRTAPNSVILEKFWSDDTVQRLPYQRGMLFATHLDQRVREATRGAKDFDDVLLEMQNRARLARPGMTAAKLLPAAVRSVARIDIRPDIARFIMAGETAPLPSNVFSPCGALETVAQAPFHRGFDIEATQAKDNVITGVRVNGPAYAAGMRDGMKLVRRSGGEIGDSQKEIAYDVLDGATARTFRYLPAGEGLERFRTLALAAGMDQTTSAACLRRLGGM